MTNNTLNILKSMSDETRLKILKFLSKGERCVCEIFPYVNKTQSTVSIHLNNLEKSGLVKSRREGKYMHYSLASKKTIKLLNLLEKK